MTERTTKAHAQAALAVCESLILHLTENGILPKQDVHGILEDAWRSHAHAGNAEPDVHEHAAHLIESMMDTLQLPPPGGRSH